MGISIFRGKRQLRAYLLRHLLYDFSRWKTYINKENVDSREKTTALPVRPSHRCEQTRDQNT